MRQVWVLGRQTACGRIAVETGMRTGRAGSGLAARHIAPEPSEMPDDSWDARAWGILLQPDRKAGQGVTASGGGPRRLRPPCAAFGAGRIGKLITERGGSIFRSARPRRESVNP